MTCHWQMHNTRPEAARLSWRCRPRGAALRAPGPLGLLGSPGVLAGDSYRTIWRCPAVFLSDVFPWPGPPAGLSGCTKRGHGAPVSRGCIRSSAAECPTRHAASSLGVWPQRHPLDPSACGDSPTARAGAGTGKARRLISLFWRKRREFCLSRNVSIVSTSLQLSA